MQIGKSTTTEDCYDFGKTNNEDSRGLMRLYIARNSISKFRGKLFEDENLKTTRIKDFGPRSIIKCA